ncbi:MAG: class F sortase [Candidatus Taylorbacteria bacterium]|nr:class F sortase [Candidatus Taylorbacteria bacterium]
MKKTLTRASAIFIISLIIFQFGFHDSTGDKVSEVYKSSSSEKTLLTEEPGLSQTVTQISQALALPVAYGQSEEQKPAELIIPSIGLHSPVVDVGINDKGEMDVPTGTTNNVGWYMYGTIPGELGSAVLDAHVFAAFKNLKDVKVGDSVFVISKAKKLLHFVVEEATVYDLADVPSQKLFNRRDGIRLNLITCAGELTEDGSTYNKRLIVYARLVE